MAVSERGQGPEFCTNSQCLHHLAKNLEPKKPWYVRFGYYTPKWATDGLRYARFKCRECGRITSLRSYQFSCWQQRRGLEHLILTHFERGASNRQIASALGCAEGTIRLRLIKMARAAMTYHEQSLTGSRIQEPVAFDGVENFSRSQYEPNNLNHLLGRRSLFMYDVSFSAMNRKGYMSDRQKEKKQEIELESGKFDSQSIRWGTTRLLLRVFEKWIPSGRLDFASDDHFLYRRALRKDLSHLASRLSHSIVPATESRTFKNLLFAINHMDNLLRHQVKAFTRETIAFSKTQGAMIQKYLLFGIVKNYCRPCFSKRQSHNPRSNLDSPAQFAGVKDRMIRPMELFECRPFLKRSNLSQEWCNFWHGGTVEARLRL